MIDSAFLDRLSALLGPKGLVTDLNDIAPWTGDWRGRYHGNARAIVAPATTVEAAAAIRLAREAGVPLVPQGGNTSMVGGATPPADGSALILSTRRMNRIRSISPDDDLAVAEAGVILSDLHDAVEAQGRRFPLSLSAKGSATIGGLTSTNAGGTQVLRFGTMRALVAGIEAVLPDGTVYDGLSALKKDNRGYDLKQLLIGAEGTLGLITAVSLRLVPTIADRAVAWVGLESPQTALALLRRLERVLPESIESFEVVPADSLALVLEHIPGTRAPLASAHPWNALIEHVGGTGQAKPALENALGEALADGLGDDAVVASSHAQEEALWHLRHAISEAERASGLAAQHDISVPVAAMPDFMIAAADAIETEFPGTTATAFGHLGDGNVHFHVRAPAAAPPDWIDGEGKRASRRVYDMVVAAGGSISAEHGIGQMKLAELERLTDPGRIAALRSIKAALDPTGIMNPGKLVRLAPETPRP